MFTFTLINDTILRRKVNKENGNDKIRYFEKYN